MINVRKTMAARIRFVLFLCSLPVKNIYPTEASGPATKKIILESKEYAPYKPASLSLINFLTKMMSKLDKPTIPSVVRSGMMIVGFVIRVTKFGKVTGLAFSFTFRNRSKCPEIT